MMRQALPLIMRIAKTAGFSLKGTIVSLDGAYDCRKNRKAIFNRGMTPNINENPRWVFRLIVTGHSGLS